MNLQQNAILLAALVSVASVSQAATVTLPDSGFETPIQGGAAPGNYTIYSSVDPTPVTGLTFTNAEPGVGGSGISANGSSYQDGSLNAPQGTQVGFVQVLGGISMSFDYSGNSNNLFNFSFDAAERYSDTGSEQVNVLLNGVLIDTVSGLSTTAFAAFTTASATLLSGTNTLTFQGVDPLNIDTTALIDNITASQVPEPASIALLAAGLFGFGASRRKKSV
ncbi:MAG: PEP-CTERM sorting domain-containing protein [Methylococcales bacterium]|nr:PEP-CTERM sorting domain-containing protein [Methylococcales bacterium]